MRIIGCFLGILILLTAFGCTPIQRGATKDGFIVSGQPNIAVHITPEMTLYKTAQKSVMLATDSPHSTSARMTYAVFGSVEGNTLLRHAHTLTIAPSTQQWIFSPETYKSRYAISTSKQKINGRNFTIQTLLIPTQDDWFTSLWQENDVLTPPNWLAMRWSLTPNNRERIVAEYREPLPPCLSATTAWEDIQTEESISTIDRQELWQRCDRELGAFATRANRAIGFGPIEEREILQEGGTRLTKETSHRPDFTHQVGELEALPRDTPHYRD